MKGNLALFGTILTTSMVLLMAHIDSFVHAEWISGKNEAPNVTRLTGQSFGHPHAYSKNQDCIPEYRTYLYKGYATNTHHTSCVMKNRVGVFTSYRGESYLQRTGSDVLGSLPIGSVLTLVPPHSDHLVVFSGGGTYKTARIYRNLTRNLSSSTSLSGLVNHTLTQASRPFPSDYTKKLAYTTASSSTSGEWVLARANNGSFARIGTATGDALYFAKQPARYPSSRIPQLLTAISSNGKYAAVASQFYSTFKLYDLSTCEGDATIKSCEALDIEAHLRARFPDYNNTRYIRFRSESTMEVNISTGYRETHEFVTLLITAPGQNTELFDYLAIGDSFASGEGAYTYKPATNTVENSCHVSLQAYPHKIGRALRMNSFDSVACSGAEQKDIKALDNPQKYIGQMTEDSIEEIVSDGRYHTYLSFRTPGYINQIDFIKAYQPRIITVSIGGNDIGFADIIKRCVMSPDTCYKTTYQKQQLEEEIYSLYPRLTQLYKDIKFASDPSAHVYVIGYPHIVAPNNRCDINVGLNASEAEFAGMLTNTINHTILRAARTAGVQYVDASDALDGHRLCEYTSVPAVHGITIHNDYVNYRKYGLVAAESFHPTSYGHELLARKILDTSSNFQSGEFTSQPYTPPRVGDGNGLLSMGELITENSPAKRRQDRNLTDFIVHDQNKLTINAGAPSASYMLRENEEYDVYLYSDPIYLGTITTDEKGVLLGDVTLPKDVPAGYHTVNIIGQDIHGDTLQVYQEVYVLDESRLRELEEQETREQESSTDNEIASPDVTNKEDDTNTRSYAHSPPNSTNERMVAPTSLSTSFNQSPDTSRTEPPQPPNEATQTTVNAATSDNTSSSVLSNTTQAVQTDTTSHTSSKTWVLIGLAMISVTVTLFAMLRWHKNQTNM